MVGCLADDRQSARGPSDAERALIAVVNDSVFVEEIYSGRRSRAGFPARLPACVPGVMGRPSLDVDSAVGIDT